MRYSFQAEMASKYGIDEAILIDNLSFWIRKNIANNKCFYEGRYWTYNSKKAFAAMFPFWTERQIRRILSNLKTKGAIYTGNFNKLNFDRTTWYALNDEILAFYGIVIERSDEGTQHGEENSQSSVDEDLPCDSENEENVVIPHLTESSNACDRNVIMDSTKPSVENCPNGPISFDQTVQPIPDSNTYSNKDINNNIVNTSCDDDEPVEIKTTPYSKIVEKYNDICLSLPKIEKVTDKRKRLMRKVYRELKYDLDRFYRIFELAEKSEFLSGRNGKWPACNFEWLIKSDNPFKILEGTYNNKDVVVKQVETSKFVNYDQTDGQQYVLHEQKLDLKMLYQAGRLTEEDYHRQLAAIESQSG